MASGLCAVCLLEAGIAPAEGLRDCTEEVLGQDVPVVQQFGDYELLEEIGRGGAGVIYKARSRALDRIVAIKMLLSGEFADAKSRQRLLREARVAARLNHPNIVTVHEVGEREGRPFFAMEYVAGPNLAQHCGRVLLPVQVAAGYASRLARAVHYAHQHGVIHRDLKPANVLIGHDDEPKLTDFGLTKSVIDPTQTIESAGSPNFMAPEQADSNIGSTGTHTDIHGLGALLYYLLTGRPPAVGSTLAETLRAVSDSEVVPPSRLRPALPRDLETITLKCLEKQPSRRYRSALEVAEDLERWQRHEPIQARPVSQMERFVKWIGRHPVTAGLAAACLLSLVSGIIATTWQWRRATRAAEQAKDAAAHARRNAYFAELALANEAARSSSWDKIRLALDRTRPQLGEDDLRGWEWRFLWNAGRSEAVERFAERKSRIVSLLALRDGKAVALGEQEGAFSIYDSTDGRLLYEKKEDINQVRQEATSTDLTGSCRLAHIPGRPWVAFTDSHSLNEGHLRIFDFDQLATVCSIAVPAALRGLAASPDGKLLACTTTDPKRRLLIYDIETGECTKILASSPDSSLNLIPLFTPDSRSVLTEGPGGIQTLPIAPGEMSRRFEFGPEPVVSTAFSPDGKWLVASGGFKPARIAVWEWPGGKLARELPARSPWHVSFSMDGRRLLTPLRIWKIPEFVVEREFDGEDANIHASVITPDGIYITESLPHSLLKWDMKQRPPVRTGVVLSQPANYVAFLNHQDGVIFAGTNGLVYTARPPYFDCQAVPQLGTNSCFVEHVGTREEIVVARNDGSVEIFDTATFERVGELPNRGPKITWMPYHPPHPYLVGARADDTLHLWDLRTRTHIREMSVPDWGSYQTASPADLTIHVLQPKGRLQGYDLLRGRTVERQLRAGNVDIVIFSPDGRYLLTGAYSGEKTLLDAATGESFGSFKDVWGSLTGAGFWPNEPRIAVAGAQVIDLVSRRKLIDLDPLTASLGRIVLISPDEDMMVQLEYSRPSATVWWAPSWAEIHQREAAVGVHAWW